MGFKCGIGGLPNVGKSTLFNALTETAAAQAANYPFCTIEPNVGEVAVPDRASMCCARLAKSAEIIPTRLTFVDSAGLVKGASKGEGLGTSSSAISARSTPSRMWCAASTDDDITHVGDKIDPVGRYRDDRDRTDARRSPTAWSGASSRSRSWCEAMTRKPRNRSIGAARAHAAARRPSQRAWSSARARKKKLFHSLGLLLRSPFSMSATWKEGAAATGNEYSRAVQKRAEEEGEPRLVISAKIESEIAVLPREERECFSPRSASRSPASDRMIRVGYGLLHLVTFFTVGPKETRAGPCPRVRARRRPPV